MNHEKPASSQQTGRPAKLRTWWHPLLVRLLNHLMARAYEVRDEELVGRMPLRVDILLIRREQGQLSDAAVRDLDVLVPRLNRFTLVEFKGPTDALERGDLAQLIGCAFLWHSQQTEALPPDDRLRGLPPEDRLRGLSAEDVVKGLSEPELARVRKMLGRDPDA